MRVLSHLFANNRVWASEITRKDPEFFQRLSRQQSPQYLWIGCSDSRVPANQIVGLLPGEMFVHRNVANLVVHTDLNCLSAIQFAVEVLHVGHIIVCGHYGCGGVLAALRNDKLGLIDNWLRHVQDVRWKHHAQLDALLTEAEQHNRLSELNVIEQVINLSQTTVARDAWDRGHELTVHGWIYDLGDGLLRELQSPVGTFTSAGPISGSSRSDRQPQGKHAMWKWNEISFEEFGKKIKDGTAVENLKQQIEGQAAAVIRFSKDGRYLDVGIRSEGKDRPVTYWVFEDDVSAAYTEDIRGSIEGGKTSSTHGYPRPDKPKSPAEHKVQQPPPPPGVI